MIKGLYNEHEFYTFNYWESKLKDEVKANNKKLTNFDERQKSLKECSNLYWDLKGISSESDNYLSTLKDFNFRVLSVLGYKPDMDEFVTQEDKYVSSVLKISGDDSSKSLMGFMISENDEGDFEQPIYSEIEESDDRKIDDRDINEILNEDLSVDSGPKWSLVLAPNAMFLIEKSKWAFGRFLKVDWDEVFSQSEKEVYDLIVGLFSSEVLVPESGTSLHDGLDDESHRHAFAVTTELREGVRESIELLVNEIIYQKKKSHEKYLKDDANKYAQELTHDALFYVYRLIFLLFLEAQGDDSDLLPLKSAVYRGGYSLDKLLETIFVDIQEGSADYEGHFLYESLDKIFSLIFHGFEPYSEHDLFKDEFSNSGFTVKGLTSDLFDPSLLKHISTVDLRNGVLQKILRRLSLCSPTDAKSRAGRISYSNLGINQLGAVYEGLLSYTGFFASEDLYALKPIKLKQSDFEKGKDLDQIYLASKSIVDKFSDKSMKKKYRLVYPKTSKENGKDKFNEGHFVLDDSGNVKIYKKGSFVYRLAGRDRKNSASYYTPESLTKITVKYALKALFEKKTSIDELMRIKIIEPAMGSGAFLNEAINQVADRILELEQIDQQGRECTPKEKRKRLSEIKYELVLNNVYGVDLNSTAVELARFSLWLNCVGASKEPPILGEKLRVGNSLIGTGFKKTSEGYYQWLLFNKDWGDYGARLKDFDADASKKLKEHGKALYNSFKGLDKNNLNEIQLLAEKAYKSHCDGNFDSVRFKRCFDLWCSYFFVDEETVCLLPSDFSEYLTTIKQMLSGEKTKFDEIVSKFASENKFFHWELEFSDVLQGGGFDLVLGNPPWKAIVWNDAEVLQDFNPIHSVHQSSAAEVKKFITEDLNKEDTINAFKNEYIKTVGLLKFLENPFYNSMKGVRKNTYKAFNILSLYVCKPDGTIGLIHEDGVYDGSGDELRRILYKSLLYHFQFQNEKNLFEEVAHAKKFSVNIFSPGKSDNPIEFNHIGNLFLPQTIEECFEEELDDLPGIRTNDGKWETRGDKRRVVKVDEDTLKEFSKLQFQDDFTCVPFVNLHSESIKNFIFKISNDVVSLKELLETSGEVDHSIMIHQTDVEELGYIHRESSIPSTVGELILSAPNIERYNPFGKQTREVFEGKHSYDSVDLGDIGSDFIPRTEYSIVSGKTDDLKALYKFKSTSKYYSDYHRLCFRRRVSNAAAQCIFGCLLPPGPLHINTVSSIAAPPSIELVYGAGFVGSLLYQAITRVRNLGDTYPENILQFPIPNNREFLGSICRRVLVLNCITDAFKDVWNSCIEIVLDEEESDPIQEILLNEREWNSQFVVRDNIKRACVEDEIDSLVALSFGLSADEFIQVYDVILGTLKKNDIDQNRNRSESMLTSYNRFKERGW